MRYLRSILAILTGLAFLVLLLVLALYVYITPERFHQKFSQSIASQFGITIEIDSLPKIQHLPKLVVYYPQTAFSSVNSELEGSIKNFSVSMSPFAVFALNPRIENIAIHGLSVTAQKDDISTFLQSLQPSRISFPLQNLTVEDAQVHLMDGKNALGSLNNIDLSWNNNNEQLASYATDFLVKHQDFTGQGKVQGFLDWHDGLQQAKWLNTQGELSGLKNGTATKFKTTIKQIAQEEEQIVFSDLQLTIQSPKTTEVILNSPRLSWKDQTISASECQASYSYPTHNGSQKFVATSPLSVTLNPLAIYAPTITVTGMATPITESSKAHNGKLEGSLFLDSPMNQGEVKLTGQIFNAPTNIQLRIANVTSLPVLNTYNKDANLKKAYLTGYVQLGLFDISTVLPQWSYKVTQSMDANVDFSINPQVSFKGLQRITGNLTLQNNEAKVNHGQFILPSGNAPFTATLANDQWQVNSAWKNLDINDLIPTIISGQCSGNLNASGNFSKPDLTRIQSSIQVGQGVLYGINFPQIAEVMVTEQPDIAPLEAISPETSCSFYNLKATVHGTNQQWTIESMTLTGDHWQAAFSGPDHQLSGQVNFVNTERQALFTLPLSINLQKSQWVLDWEAAVKSAVTTQGELPWNLQRLKNKITRKLEDWWTNFDLMNMELPNTKWPEIELPNLELPDWTSPHTDPQQNDRPQNQPI